MKKYKVILSFFVSGLLLFSCSTGPDYARNNPYDRNSEIDSLGVMKFPPSYPNKYVFTGSGLKLNVFRNSQRAGETIVFRRNGSLEYDIIDTIFVSGSTRGQDLGEYYLDTDIIQPEDIGYPLSYSILTRISDHWNFVEVDFGSIQNVTESTNTDHLIVSWQDSVFLNNGFRVLRRKDEQIYDFIDLPVPKTSFSIPLTEENLSSEYLISPYTFLHGEKTYFDTTYYYPSSPLSH